MTKEKNEKIIVGCMRQYMKTPQEMNHYIHTALEAGLNWFDHADIYGGGRSESLFGEALLGDSSLKRENMIIQSKCGIRRGEKGNYYDSSKEYILQSVDGILQRLGTDYLDVLLIHRPDTLADPAEMAEAFDILETAGKVRAFGVSNHRSMQIELLQKYAKQPIRFNQLQFSLPVSNMVANGIETNMETPGSVDHDGSILEYCRLHDITIQAWSPFQMPGWRGPFIGSEDYPELNAALTDLAEKYETTPTGIATAWILRHPAGIQIIAGTASEERLVEIAKAADITLSREDWYRLYAAAGHVMP